MFSIILRGPLEYSFILAYQQSSHTFHIRRHPKLWQLSVYLSCFTVRTRVR